MDWTNYECEGQMSIFDILGHGKMLSNLQVEYSDAELKLRELYNDQEVINRLMRIAISEAEGSGATTVGVIRYMTDITYAGADLSKCATMEDVKKESLRTYRWKHELD